MEGAGASRPRHRVGACDRLRGRGRVAGPARARLQWPRSRVPAAALLASDGATTIDAPAAELGLVEAPVAIGYCAAAERLHVLVCPLQRARLPAEGQRPRVRSRARVDGHAAGRGARDRTTAATWRESGVQPEPLSEETAPGTAAAQAVRIFLQRARADAD